MSPRHQTMSGRSSSIACSTASSACRFPWMSEKTAIRIGGGILAAAAWVVAAVLLWRTRVPDLRPPRLDPTSVLSPRILSRARTGPRLVRAAAAGVVAVLAAWAVTIPIRAVGHWWQEHEGLTRQGYASW